MVHRRVATVRAPRRATTHHTRPPAGPGDALLRLQRLAGNRAVAGALAGRGRPTVQRDLAATSDGYFPTYLAIAEALAPLVRDHKVDEHRGSGTWQWGAAGDATRDEVVAALHARHFPKADEMAAAVFDRNQLHHFEQGWDPQYGGAQVGGRSTEDTLSRQTDRPLTTAERAAAGKVFWGSLDMDAVTISESSVITLGGYARTLPGHIYFPKGSFDEGGFVPWLIHELTHIWQYQHGKPIGNVIVSAFRGHYDYGGEANLRRAWDAGENFGDFGFEQQGDILQHYYERLVGGIDTSAYDPFVDQVRSGVTDFRLPPVPPLTPLPTGTLDVGAANERHRSKIEAQLLAELRRNLTPDATTAILQRRDKVLELFGELRGYWSGTYLERLDRRDSGDELVTALHRRLSRTTIARIRGLLRGTAAPARR